jgi:hypothetical protein
VSPPSSDFTGPEHQQPAGDEQPIPAVVGKAKVFAVGDYLVGDAEDELLSGHPDIRY